MEAETLLVEYFIDRYVRKAGKIIRRVNQKTQRCYFSPQNDFIPP